MTETATAAPLASPTKTTARRSLRRFLRASLALAIGLGAWLPCVHFFFEPRQGDALEKAHALLDAQLGLWTDPARRAREVERMRASNNEWDFMGRTFLVWSLGELSLREPSTRVKNLEVMDRIIDETLAVEREKGVHFFLMAYSKAGSFRVQPPRSLFVDGEIALMLGVRRLVAERADYKAELAARVAILEARMKQGPVLCAESYPDECWIFCNTAALAAMRVADVLDGTDHRAFFRQWVETAKRRLVDPTTGILVSSFTLEGHPKDGPEGSSIWFASHCLRVVDRDFARDQYERARSHLARRALGFGWAREWPDSWRGTPDVDSGPVIPLLDASAGSSGTAFVAASSFGDDSFQRGLLASLDLAGFPQRDKDGLRYAASNQVGDAVLLYSLVLGPVWERVGAP